VSRGLLWAAAVLGLVLVAGGVVLFVLGNQPADFGWSAYRPNPWPPDAYESRLQLSFDDGPAVLWTRTSALGAGIALVGLLVLAVLAGWVAGLRSARNRAG
jgi:hypothetical protein